jgi:hypothetical protein
MPNKLLFTLRASEQLSRLEKDTATKGLLKQVRKTLGYLETDLRSHSLPTHEFESLSRRYGVKVFEAYVQQNTPAAYRIFWHYGPDQKDKSGKRIPVITIIAIVAHP